MNKRAWLVGVTASLGVVGVAAGIFWWWFAWTWGATDIEPYREGDAIAAFGCVMLVVAMVLGRRR